MGGLRPRTGPEDAMRSVARIGIGTALGIGALLGAGWLGLKVRPAPLPAPSTRASPDTVPLPPGLPPPVERYFRAAVGDRVPLIETVVVSGRGSLRLAGLTLPMRVRFTHAAGRGYRHDIDCTWFGLPIVRVRETFVGGRARLELPFGVVENDPKTDQAANQNLWGEAVWFPSVLVTDPRVRWEAVDATTAHLIVPFGDEEDRSTVTFDERTGLIRSLESRRYRAPSDPAKLVERFDALAWADLHGIMVPASGALTWLDQGAPWFVVTLDDVAYNVDVADAFGADAG
jgi:hypothetical protein